MKKLLLAFSLLLGLVGFSQVANYGYTASAGTWTTNSSPTVITGLQSTSTITPDDVLSATINIGFTFNYGNSNYTQFKASENGFITFNVANTSSQPTNNLNTSTERTIVAVLWDDNKLRNISSPYSNVNYKLSGSSPSRVLTIEWNRLSWNKANNSQGTISCQIKLYETTNVIEFIYDRTATGATYSMAEGPTSSIGLGGSSSGDFLSLSDIKKTPYPTSSNITETSTIGTTPFNLKSASTNNNTSGAMSGSNVTARIGNGTKYTFYPPVYNDNCNGGNSLSVNSGTSCSTTSSGTTVGATQSLAACEGAADDDVWYSFVATQPVHLLTENPGTIVDAVMQVYSGSCESLTTIACVNDFNNATAETSTLMGLTIGNTYFVRVHSFASGTGQGTFTMCVNTPSTITISESILSFSSCSGSNSDEQSYTISGSGLTTNIISTAPTGFELSTTSGGVFTSTITLTQTSGVVSLTTIYVRLKSDATGSPSGNITHTSTNATTQNIAVSGVVNDLSVGGTVASNQNVSSGGNAADINLSGNTGSVIKWQRSTISDFSTFTDVENTTNTVSGASIGAITQTLYYRAIVQNGTCPIANSSYVTITVVNGLPIELLYFNVVGNKNINTLFWSTASEKNNDYFNIEKTKNGNDWISILKLAGSGNSSTQLYYSFSDDNAENIINYYRLKQTDYDGKFKYSDIISIDNRDSKSSEIYRVVNVLGQEVDSQYYRGLIIIEYMDGTSVKIIK